MRKVPVLILAFMIINVAMLTRVDSGYAETINPKIDVESKTVHRGKVVKVRINGIFLKSLACCE